MSPRKTVDPVAIEAGLRAGKTHHAVARDVGCSPSAVSAMAVTLGIRRGRGQHRPHVDDAAILALHREGHIRAEIARRLNCSRQHVGDVLDEAGLRRPVIDRAAVVADLQAGMTHNRVAARNGCSSSYVNKIAGDAGLRRKPVPPTLHPHDPRWHAWLRHYEISPDARIAETGRAARRQRLPLRPGADWPPATPPPDVEQMPLGNWSIAHGTPECEAWLHAMRTAPAADRVGAAAAVQALVLSRRPLLRPTRWPAGGGVLSGPSAAHQQPGAVPGPSVAHSQPGAPRTKAEAAS